MANLRTNNLCGEGGRSAYNGSVYFSNDAVDYLSVGSAGDHNYLHDGTEDYSAEFWIFPTRPNDRQTVFSTGGNSSSTGFACRIMEDGASGGSNGYKVLCQFSRGSSGNYLGFLGGTVDVDSWSHIALQFTTSNKQLKIYVNGILTNSSDLDGTANGTFGSGNFSSSDSTYAFTIGKEPYGDTLFLDGAYISNLRICRGHIVYSSEFTPPTSSLTSHYISENDKTTILCCQDSDDPTQEATGKTISAHGGRFQTGNKNILLNGDFSQGTTGFIGDSGASISASNNIMTVTNGGGDNLYALRQDGCLRIGNTYRCTATVTPTFASGNPVFRVRFGGDAVSFTQQESTMSTGVAFRLDTGEKVADGTQFEIGSGDSSGITQFTVTDLVVTAINPPKEPKIIPPYGVDAGNTFGGAISMNSLSYMYFPTGRTEERGRGRAVLFQGLSDSGGGYTNNIDFIEITTLGNSMRFGDLGNYVGLGAAISSTTRGVFAGGSRPTVSPAPGGNQNFLEYVTIATTGNGQDFGGVSTLFRYGAGISNSTRGLICGAYQGGGASGTLNNIQYLTIATTGDTLDFGDMTNNSGSGIQGMGATSSTTRGITFGGGTGPSTVNEIHSIEIATLGNSVDFGDLSAANYLCQGVSNGTRGVVAGGDNLSGANNRIEYITIASTGNAQDFGDLSSISEFAGGTGGSNKIRGVFVGRGDWTATDNAISYITIATAANAQDFGDIRTPLQNYGSNAMADSHGGL